ncbi:MAG: DUF4870 domain-containing protein [Fastidiosipilaceae bacterium]|jgi:uncharacterized membrane protein
MNKIVYQDHVSSIGNQKANIIALIVYVAPVVLAWIPLVRYFAWALPIVFFFLEKSSQFVKFHAMQSTLLELIGSLLSIVVSIISASVSRALYNPYRIGVGFGALGLISLLSVLVSLAILIFSIIAVVKAYKYEAYHLPVIGKLADKLVERFSKTL